MDPANTGKVSARLFPPNGTSLLCKNLAETSYDDISEENIDLFKDRLLDMAGCIFGGAVVEEDRFLYDWLKRQGGEPEAPLFADSGRLPLASAVIHNCIHARANDFGNMYVEIFGEGIASHFGETLIPMGLTLADVYAVSGRDFITHNVAAEDTIARILYTLPVRWPTDMQLVSSAAAALAARYYALTPDQCRMAFSYSATNATDPGNSYFDYCQEFKFHNGESARMGILAAEIAKAGSWNGLEDPFFGHWGLISRHVQPEGKLPDLYENAFCDLGKRYYTEGRFKRGPGGIPTTAAGDCGRLLREQLIEKYGCFDGEQIKAVHVYRTSNMRHNYYENPFRLRDHTNALFSYQFAVCCALLYGERRVEQIQTKAILDDPRLIELTEQSTMEQYGSPDGRQKLKASLETADGAVLSAEVDYMDAMSSRPSREMLEAKFWDQFQTFGKLPRPVGEKIIELSGKIETLADMREYTRLLTLG